MYIHLLEQAQPGVRVDTGCILKEKTQNKFYIVLSPACDLAEREGGGCNTDRALLVEIQMLEDIFKLMTFLLLIAIIIKLKKRNTNKN